MCMKVVLSLPNANSIMHRMAHLRIKWLRLSVATSVHEAREGATSLIICCHVLLIIWLDNVMLPCQLQPYS
jgi:hypothetical protein